MVKNAYSVTVVDYGLLCVTVDSISKGRVNVLGLERLISFQGLNRSTIIAAVITVDPALLFELANGIIVVCRHKPT